EMCFQSILNQTVMPDEIIIADDGSGDQTRHVIDRWKKKVSVPIQHVWHEDKGFQLSQIRNKAIARSNSPYIVQIDGDVILNPHFIRDHKNIARPHTLVTGSRVNLSETFSKIILKKGKLPSNAEIQKNSRDYLNSLRLPFLTNFLASRYKTKGKYRDFTRGCNMAFWKDDMIKVNGYNEDMTGWGSEDKELVARMINAGFEKKFLKFSGIVYHIWHPFASRSKETVNDQIYKQTVCESVKFVPNGIDKYIGN